jgi:hypothetical protein
MRTDHSSRAQRQLSRIDSKIWPERTARDALLSEEKIAARCVVRD